MPEVFAAPNNPDQHIQSVSREIPVISLHPDEGKVRILDTVLEVMPLPEDPLARRFIPGWDAMKSSVCWDGPTVQLIRDMAIRLQGGIPSRSEGPTGVSKSFAVEVLAALTNRGYLRHNYSKDSDPGDTIGRFIPADTKIAVRFEELLADPDIDSESKALIEKARSENRPLTPYESRKVAKNLGFDGLEDDAQWRWQNGTLTGSMTYGSVYGADEPNLAPGNVLERENSALEKRPKLRLVEHNGEVIRELSPEEQSIIDSGGVIPGVIGLNNQFWYTAAQNPWGIGGGRTEESEARRNRLQDRIVEALTSSEYEEYLKFLIRGKQPDITWGNRLYKGDTDTPTAYREFENIPNVDVIILWLAEFQSDLQSLAAKGNIGTEKDIKGGSYVYTRRNIERFLDTLKGAKEALIDTEELFKSGQLVLNTNWHDLFMEAVRQEYLSGMYKEDAEVVKDLIKASGVEDMLGESINNPSQPSWVDNARKHGLTVALQSGEWVLSRASIQQLEDHTILESLLSEAASDGYTAKNVNVGEDLRVRKPLRGILQVYSSLKTDENATITIASSAEIEKEE